MEALFRLHRAHVERVSWETLWIHLGESWGLSPGDSINRIARTGRGGYCFHLNGAFGALLTALGYEVTNHVGGVHSSDAASEAELTNHLVLGVHNLPTAENPDGNWYVDVGLGDALYEPLPLQVGHYRQGPFQLELTTTPDGPGAWHLRHDPLGAFTGMAWQSEATDMDAFAERHTWLSTSPESGFTRVVTVQRRDADGVDILRGVSLTRLGTRATTSTLGTAQDFFAALHDIFRIDLSHIDTGRRAGLWAGWWQAHLDWEQAGRP